MSYYLAHPFGTRAEMRQWELAMEVRYDIEIVNPFYDLHRSDVDAIDQGHMQRYAVIASEIVDRDLEAIRKSDGVIAYIDGSRSYGTIMEIAYAVMFGVRVYIVCTNGEERHPWLRYHDCNGKPCISLNEFEAVYLESGAE